MSTKMDRVYHILHLINTSQYPSTERLCDHWEVSERTIHGDISFLKDFMNQPIKYDRNRGGYYTDEPNKPLPAVDLTDEELLALAVGKDIIARYSGGALTAPITSALDKISLRRKEKPEEASSLPLKFKGSLSRPFSRKLVEALQECIEKCFVLEIDYYAAYTNQRERRRINPHVIYESMGSWYVLAWCELRKDFRQFALHRVREFKVLRTPFQKQNSADLEKWLASTLQTEIRHPEEVVKIRFAADAAPYVREREWHEKQVLTEQEGGTLELEFVTRSLQEIKRWVLAYGASATVIEPRRLRKLVSEELARASANYEDDRSQG